MLKGYGKAPALELELPERFTVVVPSNQSAWRARKAPGARFTYVQLHEMQLAGIDPEAVETVRCRSTISRSEMWCPLDTEAPVYVFECPVLEHRANGFRLVIAPAGDRKIVHESGRLKKGS